MYKYAEFVCSLFQSRREALRTLQEAKIGKNTLEGFRIWRSIIAKRTIESVCSTMVLGHLTLFQIALQAFRFGGFAALFSAQQLLLGVHRGVHDVWNALAAGATTGVVAGAFYGSLPFHIALVTLTGIRGVRWGLIYGTATGFGLGVSQMLVHSIGAEGRNDLHNDF